MAKYAVSKHGFRNIYISGLPRAGGYSVPRRFARTDSEAWTAYMARLSSEFEQSMLAAADGTFDLEKLLADVKIAGTAAIAECTRLILLPAVCSYNLRGHGQGDELTWEDLVNQYHLVAVDGGASTRPNFQTVCTAADPEAARLQEAIKLLRRSFAVLCAESRPFRPANPEADLTQFQCRTMFCLGHQLVGAEILAELQHSDAMADWAALSPEVQACDACKERHARLTKFFQLPLLLVQRMQQWNDAAHGARPQGTPTRVLLNISEHEALNKIPEKWKCCRVVSSPPLLSQAATTDIQVVTSLKEMAEQLNQLRQKIPQAAPQEQDHGKKAKTGGRKRKEFDITEQVLYLSFRRRLVVRWLPAAAWQKNGLAQTGGTQDDAAAIDVASRCLEAELEAQASFVQRKITASNERNRVAFHTANAAPAAETAVGDAIAAVVAAVASSAAAAAEGTEPDQKKIKVVAAADASSSVALPPAPSAAPAAAGAAAPPAAKRQNKCGNFGQTGHNKTKCHQAAANAVVVVQAAPAPLGTVDAVAAVAGQSPDAAAAGTELEPTVKRTKVEAGAPVALPPAPIAAAIAAAPPAAKRQNKCGNCGQTGHYSRTCPNAQSAEAMAKAEENATKAAKKVQ